MKTKFLKKLSFVLVAAMVLSLFVPAAGVFAAKAPTLNSTNKYLHLDVEKKNEFNFNINNKQKGWEYYWESDDEDVAEVNEKNGVTTATGVGTANITVYITDADGEDVEELTAKVTVRDNIKTVKISNGPEDGKLEVDEEYDFNRSFETVSGSTKKTSSITRWTVDPAEGAEIKDNGVFVASEAGEYTITARSFQSKARFTAWQGDADKYADYVLADDELTIVVGGGIKDLSQVNLDTVKVEFDGAMEDFSKDKVVLSLKVGEYDFPQLIKEAKLADDKKSATIQLYVPFNTGGNYVFKYADLDAIPFVAATTNVEDVAQVVITTATAELSKATKVGFKLLNEKGVDLTANADLAGKVKMTSTGGLGVFFNPSSQEVTIYTEGAMTTVTATFESGKYDTTTFTQITKSTTATIVGVKAAAVSVGQLKAWTIVDNNDPKFDNVNQIIAVKDSGKLFVQIGTFKGTTAGDDISSKDTAGFKFVSNDTNKLIIGADGTLFPVAQGPVVVVIYYNDAIVGAINITVQGERVAGVPSLAKNAVQLSNAVTVNDSEKIKITVSDQYNAPATVSSFNVEKLPGSAAGSPIATGTTGGDEITVNGVVGGVAVAAGRYYYKITVGDKAANTLIVDILDGSSDSAKTVAYYRLDLQAQTFDLKLDNDNLKKDFTIKLYGYNSANVPVELIDVDGNAKFKIEIETPGDWAETLTAGVYNLASSASGQAVSKAPVGTYKVTASEEKTAGWVPVDVQSFVVVDTQPKPGFTVKSRVFTDTVDITNNANLVTAVTECFEFKLGDTEVYAKKVNATGTNTNIYVASVEFEQVLGNGGIITHVVDVKQTISKK